MIGPPDTIYSRTPRLQTGLYNKLSTKGKKNGIDCGP